MNSPHQTVCSLVRWQPLVYSPVMASNLLFNTAVPASLPPAAVIHPRHAEQAWKSERPDGVFGLPYPEVKFVTDVVMSRLAQAGTKQ